MWASFHYRYSLFFSITSCCYCSLFVGILRQLHRFLLVIKCMRKFYTLFTTYLKCFALHLLASTSICFGWMDGWMVIVWLDGMSIAKYSGLGLRWSSKLGRQADCYWFQNRYCMEVSVYDNCLLKKWDVWTRSLPISFTIWRCFIHANYQALERKNYHPIYIAQFNNWFDTLSI